MPTFTNDELKAFERRVREDERAKLQPDCERQHLEMYETGYKKALQDAVDKLESSTFNMDASAMDTVECCVALVRALATTEAKPEVKAVCGCDDNGPALACQAEGLWHGSGRKETP